MSERYIELSKDYMRLEIEYFKNFDESIYSKMEEIMEEMTRLAKLIDEEN